MAASPPDVAVLVELIVVGTPSVVDEIVDNVEPIAAAIGPALLRPRSSFVLADRPRAEAWDTPSTGTGALDVVERVSELECRPSAAAEYITVLSDTEATVNLPAAAVRAAELCWTVILDVVDSLARLNDKASMDTSKELGAEPAAVDQLDPLETVPSPEIAGVSNTAGTTMLAAVNEVAAY